MKSFLLAVLGVFICTSTVTTSLIEELDQLLDDFDCAVDEIGKVIINSDGKLKADFDRFSSSIKPASKWYRKRCHAAEDQDEVHRCLLAAYGKVTAHFLDFVKIVDTKAPELGVEMKNQIESHCNLIISTLANMVEQTRLLEKNRESPEYFQCLANAMGEAWIANGEEEVWSQFQPNLQLHLDNWKKCVDAENPEAVNKCNAMESRATFKILNECVITMNLMNPQVFLDFARISRQKCVKM